MALKAVFEGRAPAGFYPKFMFVKIFAGTDTNYIAHSADVRDRAAYEGIAIDGIAKTGYAATGSGTTT